MSSLSRSGKVFQPLRLKAAATAEYLRGSLWFIPTVAVAATLLLATFLVRVDVRLPRSPLMDVILPGSVEGARAVLQVAAGSVVTVTSVVFSLTVVALQISATNYSPRVLRTFLRDRGTHVVLGVFLSTFAYSFVVLHNVEVTGSGSRDWAPQVAIAGVVPFVLGSLAALVFFIHHVTQSIRVDTILRDVLDETLEAIDNAYSTGDRAGGALMELVPEHATPISAKRGGYVQAVNPEGVVAESAERDMVVALRPIVGERVLEGGVLGWAWFEGGEASEGGPDADALVDDALRIGTERTMQQDVPFGLRQLVDVAVRALSMGVNDPNTAVTVMSHLESAYAVLACRDLGHRLYSDERGTTRLIVPGPNLDEYLHVATQQIAHYGRSDPMVIQRLLRMLGEVNAASGGRHAATIARHVDRAVTQAERSIELEEDLDAVRDAAEQARKGVHTPVHLTRGG